MATRVHDRLLKFYLQDPQACAALAAKIEAELAGDAGGTAWIREARQVVALAHEAGLELDAERLALGDVHDLQALHAALLALAKHASRTAEEMREEACA